MSTQLGPALTGTACSCRAIPRAARSIAWRDDEAHRPLELDSGQ